MIAVSDRRLGSVTVPRAVTLHVASLDILYSGSSVLFSIFFSFLAKFLIFNTPNNHGLPSTEKP